MSLNCCISNYDFSFYESITLHKKKILYGQEWVLAPLHKIKVNILLNLFDLIEKKNCSADTIPIGFVRRLHNAIT